LINFVIYRVGDDRVHLAQAPSVSLPGQLQNVKDFYFVD